MLKQPIARVGRIWTEDMLLGLIRDVNRVVSNTNQTKSYAFKFLANEKCASPETLSQLYYRTLRRIEDGVPVARRVSTQSTVAPRSKKNAMSFAVPNVKKNFSPQNAPDIAAAIVLLKKFGATISF